MLDRRWRWWRVVNYPHTALVAARIFVYGNAVIDVLLIAVGMRKLARWIRKR